MKCARCNGSGEIGIKGRREAPGPVPDDARGWTCTGCPDCGGLGEYEEPEQDDEDDGQPDESQEWRDYDPDC